MSDIKNPIPNIRPLKEPEKSEQKIQLAKDKEQIKSDMQKISELFEIHFVAGLEESIGLFPIFEESGAYARFGYGFKSPNMSTVFFDSKNGESEVTGERNTRVFLESQKFSTKYVVQALGKFEGNEPQIEEVDRLTLKDKTKSVGNVVFTRDPEVTLIIKPADCPTGVLYCKDKDGRSIVAIIHGGAASLNAGLVRQGLQALQLEPGANLAVAKLAVFPGIKNYTASKSYKDLKSGKIKRRFDGFYEMNVGDFIAKAKTDDPMEKRVMDLISIYEMQALQAGIVAQNIQVYRIDTYSEAAKGRAFSRRYSNDHGNARPGANIIAVNIR